MPPTISDSEVTLLPQNSHCTDVSSVLMCDTIPPKSGFESVLRVGFLRLLNNLNRFHSHMIRVAMPHVSGYYWTDFG